MHCEHPCNVGQALVKLSVPTGELCSAADGIAQENISLDNILLSEVHGDVRMNQRLSVHVIGPIMVARQSFHPLVHISTTQEKRVMMQCRSGEGCYMVNASDWIMLRLRDGG